MEAAGHEVMGILTELVEMADVVVDCTPKPHGAANAVLYRRLDKSFIAQGGEKHREEYPIEDGTFCWRGEIAAPRRRNGTWRA
ncbi:hypothetical protein [Sphingopyxis chilensis]